MSIQVRNLSCILPNQDTLFFGLSFSISQCSKCALIGNNGVGKSTLLNIISGKRKAASGEIYCSNAYLVPQHFGQFDDMTISEALQISDKLRALRAILGGDTRTEYFDVLNDDWSIESRIEQSFDVWGLSHLTPETPLAALSGGEKTKVFLSGISIHNPSVVLLDEPTNHLDNIGRERLYSFIAETDCTVLVVSHDRTLLNKLNTMLYMTRNGLKCYPMAYDDFENEYERECRIRNEELKAKQRELAKAQQTARETIERQQKHSDRGAMLSNSKCLARISKGRLKNQSETSSARIQNTQDEKIRSLHTEIETLRSNVPDDSLMKINILSSDLHTGKRLIEFRKVNFAYTGSKELWTRCIDLTIVSGERIRVSGPNGCGKTTLIKLLTGHLLPTTGTVRIAPNTAYVYLDQEYKMIDDDLTVYEQMVSAGTLLPEHELKQRLHRFLFPIDTWDKKCRTLSGGEKMRLAICYLTVCDAMPDIIILDEPTNNIDISNMKILSGVMKTYKGTVVVVSHDESFVKDIGTDRVVDLQPFC